MNCMGAEKINELEEKIKQAGMYVNVLLLNHTCLMG